MISEISVTIFANLTWACDFDAIILGQTSTRVRTTGFVRRQKKKQAAFRHYHFKVFGSRHWPASKKKIIYVITAECLKIFYFWLYEIVGVCMLSVWFMFLFLTLYQCGCENMITQHQNHNVTIFLWISFLVYFKT